ncbi:MAG: tetratricopeptide repeat protein [Archangiaceae bacterium]|nr:tetratricopeptide repeat protein [Archangiaceae bacterium]
MSKSMVEKYEQVLSQDPASTVFVELAKALIEKGEHTRAIEVCQGGLQHHPSSVIGRVLWGKALIQLGKPSEAMSQFDTAVNIDKDNPRAYNLIGEVLLHKGLFRSALPILRKAAALQPNDGRIRQWLEQTRAALAGGPAPVLTESSSLAEATDDPQATAVIEATLDAAAMPTVVTQAYNPEAVRDETRSLRRPAAELGGAPDAPTQAALGSDHPTAGQPRLRPHHPGHDPAAMTSDEMAGPSGRDTATAVLQRPAVGDDDPFANVPKRTSSSPEDLLVGLTSTFNALSEGNDTPGIPLPPGDPFNAFPPASAGNVPVVKGVALEPSVIPSQDLLAEQGREAQAGLLGDLGSTENELPTHESPMGDGYVQSPRRAPAPSGGGGGLLDDIPDAIESSQIDVPKVEMNAVATEAIAKEYERELREKLAASTAKKTFLQRHGGKLFVTLGLLVVVAGSLGSYLYTRSRNQGLDLAGAIAEGRKAINADTPLQYQEALKRLELAHRMDSDNPEVQALLAYAHAVLFAEHGKSPEDAAAAKQGLAFAGVRERSPELVLVAEMMIADPASAATARAAVLSSALEKAEVLTEAGRLLLAERKPDEALKKLTRAVELQATNVRALVTLGDYYLQFEDWENAVKLYTGAAAQLSPQHPGRVLGLAEARLSLQRDLGESLADVEALTEANVPAPMRGRREVALGQLLSTAGRHEEGLKVLTAAEKQYRDQAFEVQLALGFANRAAGNMDAAQRAYDNAVKLAPKGKAEDAKEGLGRVLIARSRERELLSRLPKEADSRKVSLVRGMAYGRLGEWKNARTEIQRTQVNGKFPPESVVQLALADAAEDNSDKALDVLKKMEGTVKRNKTAVQVALGRVYMQRNELDKAKSVLEEASKDPLDYEANALLGELLVSLGLSEIAVEPLTRAVERNGSHGPSRHLLGRTQLDLGHVDQALKQAEAWVNDNPGSDDAQRDYAFALLHNGRARDAEGPINKAIKADGNNPEVHRIRAQILFAKGDPKGAIASLEKANKLNPKDAETFCEIGLAMVRQGNIEIALKAFEAARLNDPKAACGEVGPYHARPAGTAKAVKDLTDVRNKAVHSWDRALAFASIARAKLLLGALKDAKTAVDDGAQLAPFAAPVHYAAGLVAQRAKDDLKALEELQKATELDPSWAGARLAYADLLVRQGPDVLPKAVAEYEAFLTVSQSDAEVARVKNALKTLKKKLN